MKFPLTHILIHIDASIIQFAYVLAPKGDLLYTTHTAYIEVSSL